ncbi:MAG: hypothetical protein AAFZ18_11825 [Myxococcota bacterium]
MTAAEAPRERASFRARIVLRPRTLDEVFDLALAYGREHFGELRGVIAFSVFVPLLVAGATVGGWWASGGSPESTMVLGAFVLVLGSAWAERVVTVFVGRHLFETRVTLREAIRGARRALPLLPGTALRWSPLLPFLLIDAGAHDAAGALLLLLIFAAMVNATFHARSFFEGEVRLLERLSGGAARRRAHDLAVDRHGRNLIFMVPALVFRTLFVISALGASHTVFSFVLQFEGVNEVAAGPVAALGYVLSGPFIALARLFDYVDARTRGEGWDIQVRFQEIAHRSVERAA